MIYCSGLHFGLSTSRYEDCQDRRLLFLIPNDSTTANSSFKAIQLAAWLMLMKTSVIYWKPLCEETTSWLQSIFTGGVFLISHFCQRDLRSPLVVGGLSASAWTTTAERRLMYPNQHHPLNQKWHFFQPLTKVKSNYFASNELANKHIAEQAANEQPV